MEHTGWLINDYLTTIEGTKTFWHDLLDWIPNLVDKTGVPFSNLPEYIEREAASNPPDYIIRNATYFRKLNLNIPTVSLLQDITHSPIQKEVLDSSNIIVVNSKYTLSKYPELEDKKNVKVIPLGTDFNTFKPLPNRQALRQKWGIHGNTVVFVGAQTEIKGWSKLVKIIEQAKNSDLNFILVLKDMNPVSINSNKCRVFNRVGHSELVEILNCCDVGICTSETETQHLAGIEMGACGIPIVTTNVGAYYNREQGDWGCRYTDPLAAIDLMLNKKDIINPRKYWINNGFDLKSCKEAWVKVVKDLLQ